MSKILLESCIVHEKCPNFVSVQNVSKIFWPRFQIHRRYKGRTCHWFWTRLDTFGHFFILDTFGHVWTCLDMFGHVWTRSFGHVSIFFGHSRLVDGPSVQKLVLDTFGHVWTRLDTNDFWTRLDTFGHGHFCKHNFWTRLDTVISANIRILKHVVL